MKQETLEERINYISTLYLQNLNGRETDDEIFEAGIEAGIKETEEIMYSEEDLREAFKGGGKMSWTDISQETQEPYYYDFEEWFEQFKKK